MFLRDVFSQNVNMDLEALTKEFSHQYDETVIVHEEMDEDDDDEEDESSSLEEDEIEEIQMRKSKSALPKKQPTKSPNLVRNDTDSKWKDKDMNLLKLDMQQQLMSLKKEASPLGDLRDKDYKIEIDEEFDNIDDDDERLPSVKANLFRNASSEKWSDHSVKAKKKEIEREMLKLLLDSNNSSSRSRR